MEQPLIVFSILKLPNEGFEEKENVIPNLDNVICAKHQRTFREKLLCVALFWEELRVVRYVPLLLDIENDKIPPETHNHIEDNLHESLADDLLVFCCIREEFWWKEPMKMRVDEEFKENSNSKDNPNDEETTKEID